MIMKVYAVYDKAVGAFLQPFYARTKSEAVRSFAEASNDEKQNFSRHASDFYLAELGEFDDSSGLFNSTEPVRVISATECIVSSVSSFERQSVSAVNGGMAKS